MTTHPAGRKRPAVYQRWSCFLCAQDGIGGVHGWNEHYRHHHYTPGETP